MRALVILLLCALTAFGQSFTKSVAFRGAAAVRPAASSSYSGTPDILWWKGNTGSGTTDTATVGPNCTLSSASIWGTTFTPGGSTSDFVFNGSSYYGNSASAVSMVATNKLTVEFRLFQSTYSTATRQCYLDYDHGNGNTFIILNETDGDGGVLYLWVYDNSGNRSIYTWTRPAANSWQHIAMAIDNSAANAPILYTNGVVNTSIGNQENLRSSFANFGNRSLYIATVNGASGYFAPASMKDVRIFSGLRSATNILQDATNYP